MEEKRGRDARCARSRRRISRRWRADDRESITWWAGRAAWGRASLSSSLAVKFAAEGHHTLVVSTDPAHSLSDSLAQNVRGGMPVEVSDMNGMLYALEIDPESAKEEFTQLARKTDMGSGRRIS